METIDINRPFTIMLRLCATFIFSLAAAIPSYAGNTRPYQDGVEAYTNGDYEKAYKLLKGEAKAKNADAAYILGKMCVEGNCPGTQSQKIGFHWLKRASEQGVEEASLLLTKHIDTLSPKGKYSKEDLDMMTLEEAIQNLDINPEEEVDHALLGLDALRHKNFRKATRNFRKAAGKGDARAMNFLGTMMLRGMGTFKSEEQAFFWYTEAAKKGHPVAQYNVGTMLEKGRGVEKDVGEAVAYYKASATNQYPKAQYKLAKIIYEGRLMKRNSIQAYIMASEASKNGHKYAGKLAAIIFNRMSDAQRDALWLVEQEQAEMLKDIELSDQEGEEALEKAKEQEKKLVKERSKKNRLKKISQGV